MIDRRTFLRQFTGFTGALAFGNAISACDPESPTASVNVRPVGPGPSVVNPFLFGWAPVVAESGAEANVFYPSRTDGGPILSDLGPFPLVAFFHGNCPDEVGTYRHWIELPGHLARCGYVVVVPRLPGIENGRTLPSRSDHPDVPRSFRLIDWMRASWQHRGTLGRETILAGHSYGALLAGRLLAERPAIAAAVVSLSGTWSEYSSQAARLGAPSLFVHGGAEDAHADLNAQLWERATAPKYRVRVSGAGHWDYLPPSSSSCAASGRGSCPLTARVAFELTAQFLAKYVPPAMGGIDGRIHDDISLPLAVPSCGGATCSPGLGRYPSALPELASSGAGCAVRIDWETGGRPGSRELPGPRR